MGLRKKTFLYSIALAGVMIAFITGYFILMLPSLYVNYVTDANFDSVVEVQRKYVEERSYDNLAVKNPTAVFSIEIPREGNEIYIAGKFFRMTVRARDEELQEILDDARTLLSGTAGGENGAAGAETDFMDELSEYGERLKKIFGKSDMIAQDYPLEIAVEGKNVPDIYQEEHFDVHMLSGNMAVYESGVADGNYSYTTYMAATWEADAFVMTVMSTMTPGMEEITPIVGESLPMMIAVIVLVVLIASRIFAGGIVNPVIRLADYAENIAVSGSFDLEDLTSGSNVVSRDMREQAGRGKRRPLKMIGQRQRKQGGDEIAVLEGNLRELYRKLYENYAELEQKNRLLEEENERQEVFLRASSHQLKTPVAAALLLVEGMINEVGKYKDTKAYLPEVKRQLLSMRRIVDDILYLNHCVGNQQAEPVDLRMLARELAGNYAVQAQNRGIDIETQGSGTVTADREMLKIVVDNLLSNAVQYTPDGQRIVIRVKERELCVTNYGINIEEKLLPHIFEPFVTSDTGRKGKGLGLYVADYYCRRMGGRLAVDNVREGVQASVEFPPENKSPGKSGQPGTAYMTDGGEEEERICY